MSSPQDGPARRKAKEKATKKLAAWREKKAAQQGKAAPAKKS